MTTILGYDATHANLPHVPAGHQLAGYTTGSASIKWTPADWAAHPHAVRICQDAAASDTTADVLDVERGAATNAECPGWVKAAAASFTAATRPGQRWPAIYTSASNVTGVVNALKAGGVTSGCRLWVANWNLTEAQAIAMVEAAAGPFPVVGVQYENGAPGRPYDLDVWSARWLARESAVKPQPLPSGKYVADGTKSMRQLALAGVTTVPAILWATVLGKQSEGATHFGPLERDYLYGEDWDALMPAGMLVWLP